MKHAIQEFFRKHGYEIHRYQDAFRNQQKLLAGVDAPVIFDAGAHHGCISTLYCDLFPKPAIYAFEPYPDSFAVLKKRTASSGNIHAYNLALSNRCGMAEFNVNPSSATNSLLPTDPIAPQIWGEGLLETCGKISVETTTVDEFGRAHNIDHIHLLKLDVQGAEPLVLEGARQYCRAGKIDVIYTEIITMPSYSGRMELHEFLTMLHEYGFCLYNFYNFFMCNGRVKQMDAIFTRNGFREPRLDRI
ncbi:MAG: FkbM family methyltransferase [Planctomycetales bacterium]|nr:FkbM family methyltransferase [Planctomycetales bacterium]